jgi:lysozyme-like protein
VGTSGIGRRIRSLSPTTRLPSGWTASRRVITTAGAITLTTAVVAVAALASTDPPAAKEAARTTAARPPSYLQPVGSLVAQGKLAAPTLSGDTGTKGVPAGTAPVPTVPDTTNLGSRSSTISVYQGSAGTLTPAGIATLALQHGCSAAAAPVATAVAMAESGGSPSAQGDVSLMTPVWDWSAGLWQIRGLRASRGTGALRDSVANQDAAKNASAMYVISSGCTDWGPWSTYNNGAYQQFLGIATQAVRYVLAYSKAHGGQFPTVAPPDPTAVIPSAGSGGAAAPAAAGSTAANSAAAGGHKSAAPSTSAARPSPTSGAPAPKPGHSTKGGGGGNPVAPATSAARSTPKHRHILPTVIPTKLPVPIPTITKILPIPLPTVSIPHLP